MLCDFILFKIYEYFNGDYGFKWWIKYDIYFKRLCGEKMIENYYVIVCSDLIVFFEWVK